MKRIRLLNLFATCMLFSIHALYAQEITVTGKITDKETNLPLEGASVGVKNATTGVTVDAQGSYRIKAPASGTLVFSFTGYGTQEVAIKSRVLINIQLSKTDKDMDGVVVVGYKTVQRKDVSAAVTSIDVKDLQDIPSASIVNLLAGKAPGVQAVVRSGLPGGSGGGLVVRGNTSLSDASDVNGLSNPLYVVDGVPISLADLAGFDVSQNDFFATLNPDDIASIDILKDAAATAIYGSRGANGVVIIKTRRGRNMKTRFNVSSVLGVNFEPEKLKVFVGEAERQEKIRLYKESLKALFGDQAWVDVRNGLEVEGYMLPAVLTDKYNPAFNNAYDYQELFYQKGITNQTDISMEGGNEKNAFRVGLGYYDEKGVLVGFGFKRFTANASLTSDITKGIHNDISVRLSYLDRQGGQTDNLRSFPTSPTQLPSSLYYKTPDELALLTGKLGDTYNANKTYMVSLNESLRFKITKDLTLDNQAAISSVFGKKDYFVPSTASANALSYAESSSSSNITFNAHSILSYFKTFGEHEVTALAGTEVNIEQNSMNRLYGEGGSSDYIRVVQGFPKENIFGVSDIVKSNLLSYLANVSYGYKDRYKVEGVIRRDGSSRFGANNKWTTFPSVKGSWTFSREPFMKNIDNVINYGKLRISYGSSGTIDSDPLLQYNSLVNITNIGAGIYDIYGNRIVVNTYGGGGVVIPDFNKIANRSLSWSKSTEVNYGLDLELFKSRIYINADVYSRYSSGLVYASVLSPEVGYTSIRSNLVDMISNGFELGITGYLTPRNKDFQWDVTLNLARNRTTIAKLGNGGRDYINGNYAFVLNQPAFQYYTYEYLGPLQNVDDLPVNPATGEPMKYLWADAGLAVNQQGKIFPGMPVFTDVNGDYLIDGADYGYDKKIIQGKSPEPKIQGGFHTHVKFKNFNLRVQSSFALGHYIFNTSLQQMLAQYDDNTLFFTDALYDLSSSVKFWEKPGDASYYPMRYISYSDGGSARSFRESSMFIEKGDYWSLDNITLSYAIPSSLIKKFGLRGMNVYSTMRNVVMWKASHVPDPRLVTKTGYYNGQGYPINRSLSLGLNIQF